MKKTKATLQIGLMKSPTILSLPLMQMETPIHLMKIPLLQWRWEYGHSMTMRAKSKMSSALKLVSLQHSLKSSSPPFPFWQIVYFLKSPVCLEIQLCLQDSILHTHTHPIELLSIHCLEALTSNLFGMCWDVSVWDIPFFHLVLNKMSCRIDNLISFF